MAKRPRLTKKMKRNLAIVGALAVGGYFLLRRKPALAGFTGLDADTRQDPLRQAWLTTAAAPGPATSLPGVQQLVSRLAMPRTRTLIPTTLPSAIVRGEPVGPLTLPPGLVKLRPGMIAPAVPTGWFPGQCLCPPRTTGVLRGILT